MAKPQHASRGGLAAPSLPTLIGYDGSEGGHEGHDGCANLAVAIDGTPGSKALLARAEALARDAGAALTTVAARGRAEGGWWHRTDHFRAGSVTKHLTTGASCPVPVVPNAG
ncbi:MAG TPA: hypothetical protein VGF09_01870 [Solirubrobacterales bacterium]|jgi:hypothetical protein